MERDFNEYKSSVLKVLEYLAQTLFITLMLSILFNDSSKVLSIRAP